MYDQSECLLKMFTVFFQQNFWPLSVLSWVPQKKTYCGITWYLTKYHNIPDICHKSCSDFINVSYVGWGYHWLHDLVGMCSNIFIIPCA